MKNKKNNVLRARVTSDLHNAVIAIAGKLHIKQSEAIRLIISEGLKIVQK